YSPPRFLAFELYGFLLEILVINAKDVVNLIRIENTEIIRCDLRHSLAPPYRKVSLGVIHHCSGRSTLVWGFPADSGIAGIEIHPLIQVISNGIHRDGILLYNNLPV